MNTPIPSTTLSDRGFSKEEIDRVWQKAEPIQGKNPDQRREDRYGNEIARASYGKRNYWLGWEIDHIKPKAKDGTDNIRNLQPLHWKENLRKSDIYPYSDERREKIIQQEKS